MLLDFPGCTICGEGVQGERDRRLAEERDRVNWDRSDHKSEKTSSGLYKVGVPGTWTTKTTVLKRRRFIGRCTDWERGGSPETSIVRRVTPEETRGMYLGSKSFGDGLNKKDYQE